MTQPQDKMRAEFEAWAEHSFYCGMDSPELDWSDESRSYKTLAHHMAFCAWQAACAQQSAQSQQDALDALLYRHLREYASMSYPSGEGSSSKDAYFVVTGYGNVADPSIIDEAVKYEIAAQGASNV